MDWNTKVVKFGLINCWPFAGAENRNLGKSIKKNKIAGKRRILINRQGRYTVATPPLARCHYHTIGKNTSDGFVEYGKQAQMARVRKWNTIGDERNRVLFDVKEVQQISRLLRMFAIGGMVAKPEDEEIKIVTLFCSNLWGKHVRRKNKIIHLKRV